MDRACQTQFQLFNGLFFLHLTHLFLFDKGGLISENFSILQKISQITILNLKLLAKLIRIELMFLYQSFSGMYILPTLNLIGKSSENKKNTHLQHHLGASFIRLCLARSPINPIDVNFHSQKSLESLDTNSADKIQSKNYEEVESAPPHANQG